MMSRLNTVSLTGADDRTLIRDLVAWERLFQFVEWAFLYVPHKLGAPRNPTLSWLYQALHQGEELTTAIHLCGNIAFEQLLANELPTWFFLTGRLQLNVNAKRRDFTDAQVVEIYHRALGTGVPIILQYNEITRIPIQVFLYKLSSADRRRVHILLDESRGTGKPVKQWIMPPELDGLSVAFAGGFNPDNLGSQLRVFETFNRPFGVDMETGLRTDNQFDKLKVRAVLDTCYTHRRLSPNSNSSRGILS